MVYAYNGMLLGKESECPIATCNNLVNPSWQEVIKVQKRHVHCP